MKLRSLLEAGEAFLFAPQSPLPIALFRIVYGDLAVVTLLLLRTDWLNWYGVHSWTTLATMQRLEPGVRLNVFAWIPQDDRWVEALFWVFLGSAILLTAGFLTRVNTALVYLALTSIQQRNLYITHGGDTFLRVAGFFLIFAPAGAALSVDRLIRRWRGREGPVPEPRSPWAQRMIQFELALLYFAGFCSKAQGDPWVHGTALFSIFHLEELRRFPLPAWLMRPAILKLAGWWALALEFSLGVLIWAREIRYYLLALGLLLHLGIEYSLNLPLFEWDVLSAYILFIDAADLAKAWAWMRQATRRRARSRGRLRFAGWRAWSGTSTG